MINQETKWREMLELEEHIEQLKTDDEGWDCEGDPIPYLRGDVEHHKDCLKRLDDEVATAKYHLKKAWSALRKGRQELKAQEAKLATMRKELGCG